MLFLLSHSEGSLGDPQGAKENSRNPQGAWEPRHLCPSPLAAPRLLCDPVGVASLSVPLLQQGVGRSLDSGLLGTKLPFPGPASVSPPPGPPPCPLPPLLAWFVHGPHSRWQLFGGRSGSGNPLGEAQPGPPLRLGPRVDSLCQGQWLWGCRPTVPPTPSLHVLHWGADIFRQNALFYTNSSSTVLRGRGRQGL